MINLINSLIENTAGFYIVNTLLWVSILAFLYWLDNHFGDGGEEDE